MSDPFSAGTPWDDGAPDPVEVSTTPSKPGRTPGSRPRPTLGPVLSLKGQKTTRVAQRKEPKQRSGEPNKWLTSVARFIWRILRWFRTAAVLLFVLSVGGFAFAFASGNNPATAHAVEFNIPMNLPFLHTHSGGRLLAPIIAELIAVLLSWMVALIVGVNLAKPHGSFNRFNKSAIYWGASGLIAAIVLGFTLTGFAHSGLQDVKTALPASYRWLVTDDAQAVPGQTQFDPGYKGAPKTPVTPTAKPSAPAPKAAPKG